MEDIQSVAEAAPVVESAPVEAPVANDAPEAPVGRREALEKAFEAMDKPEGPTRGPDGKFVARETAEKPAEPVQQKAPDTKAPEVKTPLSEPPARFSADAKAAWEQAPEPVKGEIKRAIAEMERGIAEKDQALAPLKPYMDMAKQQGVALPEALGRYVAMEQLLYKDPIKGFEAIANNLGMTLGQLVGKITGQAPEQQATAKDQEILSLKNEIQALKGQFGQVSQTIEQQRQASVMSSVQQFAREHPRFDELAPDIAKMLQTGFAADLEDAYAKADRLNPAPQPAPVATTAPPAQTRPALSVTGAPTTGSNPALRKPSNSRREALINAFGAAGLV